jgi:hypothetical protein
MQKSLNIIRLFLIMQEIYYIAEINISGISWDWNTGWLVRNPNNSHRIGHDLEENYVDFLFTMATFSLF